jgi:hypothetical protein
MRHAARPFYYLVSVTCFPLHVMTQQYVRHAFEIRNEMPCQTDGVNGWVVLL